MQGVIISRSRMLQDLLRREKLKFARELKRPATNPGLPDADAETTYGMKSWPSNNTDDACPNDETRLPDTNNIRSPSIIPCALCELCIGTIASWETAVVPPKVEPCDIQVWPFQATKKDDDPSTELYWYKLSDCRQNRIHTHRPAAKMLLELPLSTVMAVMGPGRFEPLPIVLQVALLNVNCRTLSEDDPDTVIEPPATSVS